MPQFLNIFGEKQRPVVFHKKGVGCEYCPLDKVPGLRKIKGLTRIQKREAMLWAQSPSGKDNERGLELSGVVGSFFWETAKSYGLKRDTFDVQNVLRCRPLKRGETREHVPTNDELRCCSIYNERALELNDEKANVHLILGEVAGRQLLKKKYSKTSPVVWNEDWNAYCIIAPDPGEVYRNGDTDEQRRSGYLYYEFRDRIKAVRALLDYPGRWGYVKAQDYGSVATSDALDRLLDTLYAEAKAGRRVSLDLEDGIINGEKVPLMLGFGWGHYTDRAKWSSWKGAARSVLLQHPDAKLSPNTLRLFKEKLAKIISDPKVEKSLQHGCYDQPPIEAYLGVPLKGYTFDTQYAAYLRDSTFRSYSLDKLVMRMFMEFADYKSMCDEWKPNFANAPLERLVPYNCGDCDVTKRIEERTAPHISLPLLQVYIQVAFVLDEMENHGPLLDRPEHQRLKEAVPKLMAPIERALKQLAQKEDFNPGAPPQVAWLLYDHLGLKQLEGEGKSTQADVLSRLYNDTQHPALLLVHQFRALNVIKTTFIPGYERSAEINDDELRTVWWLTGAATGRLRSGKGGEAGEREGIINLQNTHGNPLLQNLIVSDRNWRLALK